LKAGIILKIGVDLDGVITPFKFINPSIKLPQFPYLFLAPLSLIVPPSNKIVKALQKLKSQNHIIIIISARPWWFQQITEFWLKLHKIPFDKVYCVGFGKGTKKRKLLIAKREKIDIFVEDDQKIRNFIQKNCIKVVIDLYEISQIPF